MPLITYCQRLVQRSLFSIFSVADGACNSAANAAPCETESCETSRAK